MTLLILNRGSQPRLNAPKWPFVLNKDSPQAQGLIGWWPGIGHGNKLFDLSGNNLHGDIINNFNWVPRADGGSAIDSLGTGYVQVANDDLLNVDFVTIVLWVEHNVIVNNGGLIAKGINSERQYWLFQASSGPNYLWEIDEGGVRGGAPPNIDVGVEQIITLSYDGANVRLYVDGILAKTLAQATGTILTSTGGFRIGRINAGSAISDITFRNARVYGRALTAAEVFAQANPPTKYELWYELGRKLYFFPAAAPPAVTRIFLRSMQVR